MSSSLSHLRHESVGPRALLVPELYVRVEVDDELPEALALPRHDAVVEAAGGQAALGVVGKVLLVHQRLQLARAPPPDAAPPRVAGLDQVQGEPEDQQDLEQPQGIHVDELTLSLSTSFTTKIHGLFPSVLSLRKLLFSRERHLRSSLSAFHLDYRHRHHQHDH